MSLDRLAAALVNMADTRTAGGVQRDVQRIDIGRVTSVESGKPSRIYVSSMQVAIEDDDFDVLDGYTFAKDDNVVVIPLASGGFFILGGSLT
jgi:hypothetical protein